MSGKLAFPQRRDLLDKYITVAMWQAEGNVPKAASLLGFSERTLYREIERKKTVDNH